MAKVSDLMGLGVPPLLALELGFNTAKQGRTQLVNGTVTVTTKAVLSGTGLTGGSDIILTNREPHGTPGILSVGTITDQTSFVINSTSANDNSYVTWQIWDATA